MPLDKSMSHEEKVKELMQAYKSKGKIGNTTPKNEKEALEIANAIAYNNESLDFKLEEMNMQEKLAELKKLVEEGFPVVEAVQTSDTKYDQESQENKGETLRPETDKSFEEDRLNLEEILNQSTNFKKNYVKKVVNTVNKLIDGTADIEDLTKVVKGRRKKLNKECK